MYRQRLREKYTPKELANIYKRPHNHSNWLDHRYRVNITIGIGKTMLERGQIVDLSAGDGAIARGIARDNPGNYHLYLGDYAHVTGYQAYGPMERTIQEAPTADLFICSETLEHLDNPEEMLLAIRRRADCLLLSTPDGETSRHNPEHYWGWDSEEIHSMLINAGWDPMIQTSMSMPGYEYKFQIWGCK